MLRWMYLCSKQCKCTDPVYVHNVYDDVCNVFLNKCWQTLYSFCIKQCETSDYYGKLDRVQSLQVHWSSPYVICMINVIGKKISGSYLRIRDSPVVVWTCKWQAAEASLDVETGLGSRAIVRSNGTFINIWKRKGRQQLNRCPIENLGLWDCLKLSFHYIKSKLLDFGKILLHK